MKNNRINEVEKKILVKRILKSFKTSCQTIVSIDSVIGTLIFPQLTVTLQL